MKLIEFIKYFTIFGLVGMLIWGASRTYPPQQMKVLDSNNRVVDSVKRANR